LRLPPADDKASVDVALGAIDHLEDLGPSRLGAGFQLHHAPLAADTPWGDIEMGSKN
jgi:hypothetical protein